MIYDSVVSDLLVKCLEGYNATILVNRSLKKCYIFKIYFVLKNRHMDRRGVEKHIRWELVGPMWLRRGG